MRTTKKTPKLPGSPNDFYAEDWNSWYNFLGTGRPDGKYATLAEASEAAQRLGFKTSTEYFKGYKQDPKLSTPSRRNVSQKLG